MLTFAMDDGSLHNNTLDIGHVRLSPGVHAVTSAPGRDVIDLFRLTPDRSVGHAAVTDSEGDLRAARWPDGEPRR